MLEGVKSCRKYFASNFCFEVCYTTLLKGISSVPLEDLVYFALSPFIDVGKL
jgi:hypothetical protein